MSGPRRVIVVGAGISGLALTYELAERAQRFPEPLELICLERSNLAGGNIRSLRDGGFLCEWGPTGFLDNAPATLTLIRRLGLDEQRLPARDDARRRYVFRNRQLHLLPTSPGSFLRSPLLSTRGRLRVLGEPWARRKRDDADESVHAFASRRIGREAADVLVDAMVSGIWAGDARRLSLAAAFPRMAAMEREYGGLMRAMRKKRGGGGGPFGPGGTLTSFRGGMQALTDSLAAKLGPRLRLGSGVRAISDLGRRGFRVHLEEGAPLEADAVAVATTAPVAARLTVEMDAPLAGFLEAIPHAPLAVVHLGFVRDALDEGPSGFGFLAPRGEGLRILGCLWPSDVFDGRAPKGMRLMTAMIGGAHDPQAVEMNDAGLVRAVREDLRVALGTVVAPRFTRVVRHPLGIPQYTLGHLDRVAEIDGAADEHGGLYFAGNALHGLSVNDCVDRAGPLAERILEDLQSDG